MPNNSFRNGTVDISTYSALVPLRLVNLHHPAEHLGCCKVSVYTRLCCKLDAVMNPGGRIIKSKGKVSRVAVSVTVVMSSCDVTPVSIRL